MAYVACCVLNAALARTSIVHGSFKGGCDLKVLVRQNGQAERRIRAAATGQRHNTNVRVHEPTKRQTWLGP
jgi:hypothetical protein